MSISRFTPSHPSPLAVVTAAPSDPPLAALTRRNDSSESSASTATPPSLDTRQSARARFAAENPGGVLRSQLLAQVTPPNVDAPATPGSADIDAAIDDLQLPEGRYRTQIRLEGGVSGNETGDVNAYGQASYRGDQVQAVLRGEVKLDRGARPDGSTAVEYAVGGGLVIGLDPIRDQDAVRFQNQAVSDLGDLNDRARRLAREIGAHPELSDAEKIERLEELGNALGTELLEATLAVQNSERGQELPNGLMPQLELRMNGPFGRQGAFDEIGRQIEALGAENPFPSTTEAVRHVRAAVESAGENPVEDAGAGDVYAPAETLPGETRE